MFTEESLEGLVSQDPATLADINVFTYQLISTPSGSRFLLREAAVTMWTEELLLSARASDENAARVKDLRAALAPTGLLERVGEDRIFATLPTAVEAFHIWQGTR